jgi:hypothetical protein
VQIRENRFLVRQINGYLSFPGGTKVSFLYMKEDGQLLLKNCKSVESWGKGLLKYKKKFYPQNKAILKLNLMFLQ